MVTEVVPHTKARSPKTKKIATAGIVVTASARCVKVSMISPTA